MIDIAVFITIVTVFGIIPLYFYLKQKRQPERIHEKSANTKLGYKECPECHEISIPKAWILFDGFFFSKNDCCYRCQNCQNDIRKSKWFLFDILFPGTWLEGTLFLLLALWLSNVIDSLIFGVTITFGIWLVQHLMIEYTAPLEKAKEEYCESCLSETHAYLMIVLIVVIVIASLYSVASKVI